MRIEQITSSVICGPKYVGKWYCVESVDGPDGDPIHRYLQHDGSWGKTTQYFDSEADLTAALNPESKPDFSLSQFDLECRAVVRQDVEQSFAEEDYEPC